MKKKEITKILAASIRKSVEAAGFDFDRLQEIRMRIGGPLTVLYCSQEFFLCMGGALTHDPTRAYIVSASEIRDTLQFASSYSLYAYEDEIRQGFLTLEGGHRIGVAGKIVMDKGRIGNIRNISCLNIRLSHQIKGCADAVMPYMMTGGVMHHTLIISPPRCGKTTLLRDMIRQISDGTDVTEGMTVGVVDERSEIGGAYQGVPQNELGIRTDLLDCCPKAEGMMMLIRSMSPQVIAVDELGDYGDIHAIESVIHCGCYLLATVHGSSIEDIQKKPLMQRLVRDHVFERYILLGSREEVGTVRCIFNERGMCLYAKSDGCHPVDSLLQRAGDVSGREADKEN